MARPKTAQKLTKPESPIITASEPVKPTKALSPVVKPEPKLKPRTKPRKQASPSPQGNSAKNAKRGTTTGRTPKAGAKSGDNATRSSKQGNADAANYRGSVFRKIYAAKRDVNVNGVVNVSFSVSATGSLTRLVVSSSSGSAKLDRAAMKQVRRAAPFAPPPIGAARSFNVEIRGNN